VREHARRGAQTRVFQRGRPEQSVEVEDVLADEVIHLGLGIRFPVLIEIEAVLGAVVLERGEVTNRRIEPDVEELARRIGNFKAEVGRVARDVPVAQIACQPFLHFVGGFGLQGTRLRGPLLQETLTFAELEEIVLG